MRLNTLCLLSVMLFIAPITVSAGDIDSPGPPSAGSGMYTIEDIYNYLADGTEPAISSTFKEPTTGPGATMKSTKDIYNDTRAKFDSCDTTPDQVMDTVTFFSTGSGNWGPRSGTMPNQGAVTYTPTTTDQAITEGYHNGSGKVQGDPDLISGNIANGIDIFGVNGSAVGATGDATAGEVLTGKIFSRSGASGLTGTMPDNGAVNITPTTTDQAIAAGYHNGSGKVQGDTDLVTGNIKKDVNIFGVAGDPNVANTSSGDAVAGEIFNGKKVWVDGSEVTGTMTDNGAVAYTPTTTEQTVSAGYHNGSGKVQGDPDLTSGNIKSGVSIFSVAGTSVQASGEATDAQVLTGITYSNASGASTGTMPDNGAVNIIPTTSDQAIGAGYHNGSGQVEGDEDLAGSNIKSGVTIFGVAGSVIQSTGDATEGDVLTGKIFSRSGAAGLTGAMPDNGAGGTITPGTTNQTVAAGYWSSDNTVSGDAGLVTGNLKSGVSIFGVNGKDEVVDTTEATNSVTAERMKTGDIAFVNGAKLTGTGTKTLSSASDTVDAGYYETTTLSAVDTDLAAGNIKDGVEIFGVAGERHGGCDCSEGTLNGTRWCDNGDGTVTDLTTCLMWLQKADWGGQYAFWVNTIAGTNAHDKAAQLQNGVGGLSDGSVEGDWRLPTKTELYGLANGTEAVRSGSMRAFTGVQSFYYWSSTTYASSTSGAWDVYMNLGSVSIDYKDCYYYVWPVRADN